MTAGVADQVLAARRRPRAGVSHLWRSGGDAAVVPARHAGLAPQVRHRPRRRQRARPRHHRAGPLGLWPQRCAAHPLAAGIRRRHGGADGPPGASPVRRRRHLGRRALCGRRGGVPRAARDARSRSSVRWGRLPMPAVPRRCPAFHRFCFTVLPRLPALTAGIFRIFRWTPRPLAAPCRPARHLARRAAATRRCSPSPEICERLLGSFREGLRPGMRGPVMDLALFARPWGVDLCRHRCAGAPVDRHGRHGGAARCGPRAGARIGGCSCEELTGEGHFWVAANYARVLDWVATTVRADMSNGSLNAASAAPRGAASPADRAATQAGARRPEGRTRP